MAVENPIAVNHWLAGKAIPEHTKKWWGGEWTFHNANYCCKTLVMNEGGETSMHFHVNKHETLYVASGILTLNYIHDKKEYEKELKAGEAWIVPPGFVHKLSARHGDVVIVEASTYDASEDSIRIA